MKISSYFDSYSLNYPVAYIRVALERDYKSIPLGKKDHSDEKSFSFCLMVTLQHTNKSNT